MPQEEIEGDIQAEQCQGQDDLQAARQSGRVDDRHQIAIDKTAGVAGITGCQPQAKFEWCERADQVVDLDKKSPDGAWQVQP